MALKLSREQVIQLLRLSNGNVGAAVALGVPQNQILAALVSSPDLLTQARTSASSKAEELGVDQFREDFEYDPDSNINAIKLGYESMPENYRGMAQVYFDLLKETGGVKTSVDAVNKQFENNKQQLMADFGLDENQFDDFKNTLKKDSDEFFNQERSRRQNQYKAFLNRRKKLGVEEGGDVTEAVLAEQTGFSGLSSLPTSYEDFLQKETDWFSKEMRKRGKDERAVSALLPQFQEGLKKKVGEKNFRSLALTQLLKQNLLGE